MKKIALGLLSLFLVVGTINAQEGKKALKKGSKMLQKYSGNAIDNADQLDEGLMLVKKAFEDEEVKAKVENFITLGAAYNDVASGQINAKLLDKTFNISNANLALEALETFKKAYSMAEKKGDKKDALEGLQMTESHLNNIGIYYFQEEDYPNAFDYFNGAIQAYKAIKEMGGDSRLDNIADRKDHYFYTGAAGYYGNKGAATIPVLEEFLEIKGEGLEDKGMVYEALYNLYSESDKDKAKVYLERGREAFPEDTGLLFAEINYYLQNGELDKLTEKLKVAIEKEPENVSIRTTLGSVYDQLSVKERSAGNIEKADEFFDLAFRYYGDALSIEESNFDALYSRGALYYNKAATYTDRINELANDFTPEGTKKYDALKLEMNGLFAEALPHFLLAHDIDNKDLNTLIALKEIYARLDDLEKSGKFKKEIEAIQAGGN